MKDLDDTAEENNIQVHDFKMKSVKSVSVPDHIGIDERKFDTRQELNTCLAHELGHCMTGSFYSVYCKFDTIERHEYRADRWAIEYCIPFDDLAELLQRGTTEIWSVAQYFEVTEELVKKAFVFYEEKLINLRSA